MNAKDYLEGIRMIEGDMERTLGRIKRCEDQLGLHGIRYDDGGFSRSAGDDPLSEGVVELMQYRQYLDAIQDYYISLEKEADFVIGSVRDPKKRRVLGLRFMDGMTFREIGSRVGYSDEWTRRLCDAAVSDLEPFLVPLLQEFRKELA